jgi:ubiquinol-cytochrome c reductase cytochrome c subunit
MRTALAALVVSLVAAPSASAQGGNLVDAGRNLYAGACVACHGPDLLGVTTKRPGPQERTELGPPLVGVGAQAAHFYLSTGYMPIHNPYKQPRRRPPIYTGRKLDALVAYIASYGGPGIPQPHPERGNLAEGQRLFTDNCSGCHQVVGAGGVVTDVVAPPLERATATQIAEAVRVGPNVMPQFSEQHISARELDSIVRYVLYAKNPDDRGGWALGHLGPVPEGLVAWLIAGTALVLAAVAIGSRVRRE